MAENKLKLEESLEKLVNEAQKGAINPETLETLKGLDKNKLLAEIEKFRKGILDMTGEASFVSESRSLERLEQNDLGATDKISLEAEEAWKRFVAVREKIKSFADRTARGANPVTAQKRGNFTDFLNEFDFNRNWHRISDMANQWNSFTPYSEEAIGNRGVTWKWESPTQFPPVIRAVFPDDLLKELMEVQQNLAGIVQRVIEFNRGVTGTYLKRQEALRNNCKILETLLALSSKRTAMDSEALPAAGSAAAAAVTAATAVPAAAAAASVTAVGAASGMADENARGGPSAALKPAEVRFSFDPTSKREVKKNAEEAVKKELWLEALGVLITNMFLNNKIVKINRNASGEVLYEVQHDKSKGTRSSADVSSCYLNSKGELEIRFTSEKNRYQRQRIRRGEVRMGTIEMQGYLAEMEPLVHIITFDPLAVMLVNADPLLLGSVHHSDRPNPCTMIGNDLKAYREYFTNVQDLIAEATALSSRNKECTFFDLRRMLMRAHQLIRCPAKNIPAFLMATLEYIRNIPNIKENDYKLVMINILIDQSKLLWPELYSKIEAAPSSRGAGPGV